AARQGRPRPRPDRVPASRPPGNAVARAVRGAPQPRTSSRSAAGRDQRLVHELVGQLVVLAPYGRVANLADPRSEVGSLLPQRAQGVLLDLPLAAHLMDDELRVGDDLALAPVQLARLPEALDGRPVLRDVVPRHPDRLAVRREHSSILGLEHVRVCGRAWITPGT